MFLKDAMFIVMFSACIIRDLVISQFTRVKITSAVGIGKIHRH